MTDRLPRRQRPDGWDAVAGDYEAVLEPLTRRYAERLVALLEPAPGDRVVDLACGPGVLSDLVLRAGASVTAVDFSPAMVERARTRLGGRVEVRRMDVTDLDLPTDGCDAAASSFGLIFVPAVDRALREAVRIVRPGGRVGLSAWTSPDALEWAGILDRAVRTTLGPDVEPAPPVVAWRSPAELAATLITAGLDDVQIAIESHAWELASPDVFGAYLRISPNSAELFDHLDPPTVDRIVERAVAEVADRHGSGPVELASEAYVAVGTVPATDAPEP